MKRVGRWLLLAGSFAAAGEPEKIFPVDPVAPFRTPLRSGRSTDAAPASFAVGGGRYTFSSGTLWEVSSKEGRRIGLYFEGKGTLAWSAGDPAAARVFTGNAERIGGFETGPEGALVSRFEHALFMFSEAATPNVPAMAEGSAAPENDPQEFRRRFDGDQLPSPEVGLAAAGKDGRYFEALIQSAKDLRHSVDETLAFDENLFVVEKPPGPLQGFPDARLVRTAGRRNPTGGPRAKPRIAFEVVGIALDVRERDGEWGSFEVEETLRPLEPFAAAVFRFFSGRTNSKGERALTRLSAVELSDGTPLPYSFEKDQLMVFFPTPRLRGAETRIRLRYEACLFRRDDFWELFPGGAWYPQPMPRALFTGSRHTGRVTVRAKKPLLPFASGETVRRGEDGDWNIVETRLKSLVRFTSAVAAPYAVREDTRDGVTLRLASWTPASDEGFERLAALFHRLRRLYEGWFGSFPWKEFTAYEVASTGDLGGISPGMTRIAASAFGPNDKAPADFFPGGTDARLAHEIAQAWWSHVVWAADASNQWIDEAFAELAAARAMGVLKGAEEAGRIEAAWRRESAGAVPLAPLFLAKDLTAGLTSPQAFTIFRARAQLLSFKGALLLSAIGREIGEEKLFAVQKSFLGARRTQPAATTDEFVRFLSAATKKDWKPWFEKYYYGFETP